MSDVYIGLMSGTSLDGVDGVVADFEAGGLQVLAAAHRPFDAVLRDALLALNTPGDNELHRAALAANALVRVDADVVAALRAAVPDRAIAAIGAHGQTVRHRPAQFDGVGYTVQLNAPALLAELTALPVVADFRSRDLAAGGQAAPLVPAFHRTRFGREGRDVAVVNIGGISNLTLLHADGVVAGFDCGPGNALMDLWCLRHLGRPFDDGGAWAASGQVLPGLLDAALQDPYFASAPPKSTGRDDFHAAWLEALLARSGCGAAAPENVQATLCALTAATIAADLRRALPGADRLLVCGGGALNGHLLACLRESTGAEVVSTAVEGLPPLQVEACAFAWLARAHHRGEAGNVPRVTGARGPRVLGALYPA